MLACRHPPADGVSDSTFVQMMTSLRLVASDTGLDSAKRVLARDSVLRRYRVTAVQLESAASRLAERPDHAAQLLHAIDNKVAVAQNRARPPVPVVKPPAKPAT